MTSLSGKIARALVYLLAVVALYFLAEDLSLRYRFPRREPLGSVTVQRYYALHKSKDKTDFMFADPEQRTCVHGLFPHLGYPPCWYLRRHAEQRVDYR